MIDHPDYGGLAKVSARAAKTVAQCKRQKSASMRDKSLVIIAFLFSLWGGSPGHAQNSGEDRGSGFRTWGNNKWFVKLTPPGVNRADPTHGQCTLGSKEPTGKGTSSFFVGYTLTRVSVEIGAEGAEAENNKTLSFIIDGNEFGPRPVDWMGPPNPNHLPMLGAEIPPLKQRAFFAALQVGKNLEIKSENHSWKFNLDGIEKSVKDLFSCIEALN